MCDLPEQNEGLQERVGARIGKAQAGGALAIGRDRIIDGAECIFGEHAVVAEALELDKPAIGGKADLAQLR